MQIEEITNKVIVHETTLFGKAGSMGIAHKVNIMWRAHVWVLCTLSAAVGFFVRPYVEGIFK